MTLKPITYTLAAERQSAAILTAGYLGALSLIALLALGGYFVLSNVDDEQKSNATLINIGGRQRQLSQSIALYALKLVTTTNPVERGEIRAQLVQLTDLMQRSHNALTTGNGDLGLPRKVTARARRIYFQAPFLLDQSVQNYLEESRKLSKSEDSELTPANPTCLSMQIEAPGKLVQTLDYMVGQYEIDAQDDLRKSQSTELLFFLLTLAVLICEGAFVFRPMSQKILRQIRELSDSFENTVVGFHWVATDGTVLRANNAQLEILGYEASEVIGHHISEFYAQDEIVDDLVSRLTKNENLRNFEARFRSKDGTLKNVLIDSSPYYESGKFLHSRLYARDVTAVKAAELAAKAAEERYDLAVEGSQDGIWDWDLITNTIFYSQRCFTQLGYQPQEPTTPEQSMLVTIIHPEDRKAVRAAADAHLKDRIPYDMQYRALAGDGSYKWIQSRGQAQWDADGKPTRFAGSHRDINERILAQEQLKKSDDRFRQMADNIHEIFWITDAQGRTPIYLSPAYEKVYGRPLQALYDDPKQLFDATYSEDRAKLAEAIRKQRASDSPGEIEFRIIRGDGAIRWVWVRMFNVFGENGAVSGICGVTADITDRKESETRVSEFYSTVSHELRTPLTSIRGSFGLIEGGKAGDVPPKMAKLVEIGVLETDRLIRLINDILDIKKIETGEFDLIKTNVATDVLIARTLTGIDSMAGKANIHLESTSRCDAEVLGDFDRLIQVLTNLVSNAIKFSPAGSTIIVSAERINRPADSSDKIQTAIRFSVKDQGQGIKKEDQHKLFKKFQQIDQSSTRLFGGTGLGLAISKAIVEQHDGVIGFDTEVGYGSTFWFELPEKKAPVMTPSQSVL